MIITIIDLKLHQTSLAKLATKPPSKLRDKFHPILQKKFPTPPITMPPRARLIHESRSGRIPGIARSRSSGWGPKLSLGQVRRGLTRFPGRGVLDRGEARPARRRWYRPARAHACTVTPRAADEPASAVSSPLLLINEPLINWPRRFYSTSARRLVKPRGGDRHFYRFTVAQFAPAGPGSRTLLRLDEPRNVPTPRRMPPTELIERR